MRFFLGLVALLALLGVGGYYYFQQHPEALPQQAQLKQFEQLKQQAQAVAEKAKARFATLDEAKPSPLTKFLSRVAPMKPKTTTSASALAPMSNPVTLYLVNGGIVTGDLVSETPQEVTLRFEYGDVGFRRAEIKRLVKGKENTGGDNLTIPWENTIPAPKPKPKAPSDASKDKGR